MKKIIYVVLAALSFGHATLSQAYSKVTLNRDNCHFLRQLVTQASTSAQQSLGLSYVQPQLITSEKYHVSLNHSPRKDDNQKCLQLRQNINQLSFKVIGVKSVGKGSDQYGNGGDDLAFIVAPIFKKEQLKKDVNSLFHKPLLHITVAKASTNYQQSSLKELRSELEQLLTKKDAHQKIISAVDVKWTQ
jgi:ribosomal protein L23